ncbi:MAG: hypothetical protein J7621_23110 [Niastella sp.]|nr:hypothetical protein [Niastella sp.]
MDPIQLNTEGDLIITPSASSSQHDFDFLQGRWQVHNRKLKSRLNNCTEWTEFPATQELRKILLGMGNTDTFSTTFDGKPFEGMTLRLFNPATRLWSIYWADSNMVTMDPPVVGSFHEGVGHFFTKDTYNDQEIIVRFNWDATNPAQPVWSQAFSADKGETWEWNWYMYFTRV